MSNEASGPVSSVSLPFHQVQCLQLSNEPTDPYSPLKFASKHSRSLEQKLLDKEVQTDCIRLGSLGIWISSKKREMHFPSYIYSTITLL